jgi:hypothetical protein
MSQGKDHRATLDIACRVGHDSMPACDLTLLRRTFIVPPSIHAAALESRLFASLKLNGDCPTWKCIVADPSETGRLADTIHGALEVYDLPDLVAAFRRANKD